MKRSVLEKITESYTRESGVRALEKQVAKAVRFAAKSLAMNQDYNDNPDIKDLFKILQTFF